MTEQAINSDTVTHENPFHSSAVKQQLPKSQPLPVPESEKIATDKYNEMHSCVATKVRADVDNVGRRQWLFTTDKGPLTLHSFYGKELVKALPPNVEHLAGNTETACNLKLFWRWKQVVGRKDVREITDIMRLPDVDKYEQRAAAFTLIQQHYGLSPWDWKTYKPRAENELGDEASVEEYMAAYERYAKQDAEQKAAMQRAKDDPYFGTPLTKEIVDERLANMPEPPKVHQEENLATKTKPTATDEKPQEETAPVRPTLAEIDAAKVKIRDYGVETLADFKAATGFDNIPAAIEAGKSLKELEDAAWNWDMKRNEENAQKAADLAPQSNEAPTELEKANEQQQQEKPRSEIVDKVVPPEVPKPMAIVPVQNQLATLPMVAQWDLMRQQADVLIKSGFMPQSLRTPEQVITVMMMGQALKIEPIVAISMINVVSGKPTVSPQLMMALVRKSGQLESFKVTDDGDTCTVNMTRRNEPEHIETFSMKDAASMQLVGKDNWKKQPAVMRKWRAIAAACRVVFPDVCWGIAAYTPEEIDPDIVIEAEAA